LRIQPTNTQQTATTNEEQRWLPTINNGTRQPSLDDQQPNMQQQNRQQTIDQWWRHAVGSDCNFSLIKGLARGLAKVCAIFALGLYYTTWQIVITYNQHVNCTFS
jgi:hypothetical protein